MINIQTGIYIGVAGILLWAAATDLKDRRIPNIQPLIILGLFGILALSRLIAGDELTHAFLWPALSGLIVFAFCIVLFALRLMGGGDVKLMAVVALIAGPAFSLSFLFYVAIAGGIVAFAMMIHKSLIVQTNEPPKVPYGVAIMAGGVWVCFQKIPLASA
ncbi:A24 family peptidase [Kordiimonas aquimaris]|uniref:A24 family peptidase n=1 Tax=Kordiimonas aquimaris TaxID=707591 RepID=UPI0021D03679|nr:prepilin peptidase [Kordiimonas aquimaris]